MVSLPRRISLSGNCLTLFGFEWELLIACSGPVRGSMSIRCVDGHGLVWSCVSVQPHLVAHATVAQRCDSAHGCRIASTAFRETGPPCGHVCQRSIACVAWTRRRRTAETACNTTRRARTHAWSPFVIPDFACCPVWRACKRDRPTCEHATTPNKHEHTQGNASNSVRPSKAVI